MELGVLVWWVNNMSDLYATPCYASGPNTINAGQITDGIISADRLPDKKQHTPDIHNPIGVFAIHDIAPNSTLVVQIPTAKNYDAVVVQLENWAGNADLEITSMAVALAEDTLDDGLGLTWHNIYTAGQKTYNIAKVGAGVSIPTKGHISDLTILTSDGSYNFIQFRIYFANGAKVRSLQDNMFADMLYYPGEDIVEDYACDVLEGDSVTTIGAAALQRNLCLMLPGGVGFSGKTHSIQVVSYGDSLMYGAGASRVNGAWLTRATRLLSSPELAVAYNNNGKVGQGHQETMLWARCDSNSIVPDVLVINVNSPNSGDLDGVGFYERLIDTIYTIEKYNALGSRVFVTTQPPFTSCTHTEERLLLNKLLIDNQKLYRYTVIDLAALWQDAQDPSIWKAEYYLDGVHPNEDAHIAAGNLAYEIMRTLSLFTVR